MVHLQNDSTGDSYAISLEMTCSTALLIEREMGRIYPGDSLHNSQSHAPLC